MKKRSEVKSFCMQLRDAAITRQSYVGTGVAMSDGVGINAIQYIVYQQM